MGGPGGSKMVLSLQYGHGFLEMMLSLKRGYDYEGSIHGFCHGWQNGFPGTLKSCSRLSVGSVPVFSRPGAGKTQNFSFGIMDSANSSFRPLTFFSRFFGIFDPSMCTAFQVPPREYEGK